MKYFDLNDQKRMESQLLKIKENNALINNIKLIGHRGMGVTSLKSADNASLVLPENTIVSFKEAIILGADGIELDVFSSKDRQVVVIHSDQLWLHVSLEGDKLPRKQTKKTFVVGKKNLKYLKKLTIGPQGESIPTLTEVLELVAEANLIRKKLELPNLIINIEFKNSKTYKLAIKHTVQDSLTVILQNLTTTSNLALKDFYFCSFNHEALQHLLTTASVSVLKDQIQFAAGVTSVNLFGEHSVDSDYRLVNANTKYLDEDLLVLKTLFDSEPRFVAYDTVIWNIYRPFIQLACDRNKQLHISAPNYRMETVATEFCILLLKISDKISQIFFKCDAVTQSRQILIDKANKLHKYRLRKQSLLQPSPNMLEPQSSSSDLNSQQLDSQQVLGYCLRRPTF